MEHPKKKSLSTRHFQRALHRSKILDLIRTTGLISRTDLARETGLSQASVTGITADLITEGLIEEKKTGAYEGGRRPILLAIRADGVHVIGVNMSIDQIRVVIVNFNAEVKSSHLVKLSEDCYFPEDIAEIIAQSVRAFMWEENFSKNQIAGVGVGIPGPVDAAEGVIRFLPNYGWEEVPFREMLEERLNHPVFIDNSSNNLAIAEYWYGNAKGVENFLVVTIENGVGVGVVINGQLIRGNHGIAGEFGHTCADPDGPPCRCGRRGCIEAFAGNISIVREARQLVADGLWYSASKPAGLITFTDVLAELETDNPALEKIYRRAGQALGTGIFNLVMLLDPERVIITGKGVQAGEALLQPMFETIERLKKGRFGFSRTEMMVHTWTDEDWARESGTLVLREIYKSPFFK